MLWDEHAMKEEVESWSPCARRMLGHHIREALNTVSCGIEIDSREVAIEAIHRLAEDLRRVGL